MLWKEKGKKHFAPHLRRSLTGRRWKDERCFSIIPHVNAFNHTPH